MQYVPPEKNLIRSNEWSFDLTMSKHVGLCVIVMLYVIWICCIWQYKKKSNIADCNGVGPNIKAQKGNDFNFYNWFLSHSFSVTIGTEHFREIINPFALNLYTFWWIVVFIGTMFIFSCSNNTFLKSLNSIYNYTL